MDFIDFCSFRHIVGSPLSTRLQEKLSKESFLPLFFFIVSADDNDSGNDSNASASSKAWFFTLVVLLSNNYNKDAG